MNGQNQEQNPTTIPLIAYERMCASFEKSNKRQWVCIALLSFLLFATNLLWIIREQQFETVETVTHTIKQDADNGTNQVIGGDYYGETNDNDYKNEETSEETRR